jgi:hypothetical protein
MKFTEFCGTLKFIAVVKIANSILSQLNTLHYTFAPRSFTCLYEIN